MKIAILGAGAMGCRIGASLYKAGYDVNLIDEWEEHIKEIQLNGLKIQNEEKIENLRIKAFLPKEEEFNTDLIILLTKPHRTDYILEECKGYISNKTTVLSLQNGLGNIKKINNYVSINQMIMGVTTYSAKLKKPGLVEISGTGYINLGVLNDNQTKKPSNLIQTVLLLFNNALLNVDYSENVLQSIWEKAAFNSVLNPLCSLTESPVKIIGQSSLTKNMIDNILEEIIKVAKKESVFLNKQSVIEKINIATDQNVSGNHYTSMYNDLKNARPTEIDYLNGEIVKLAKKYKMNVPYNEMIYNLIKVLEMKRLSEFDSII